MTKPIAGFEPHTQQKHPWDLLGVGALIWAVLFGVGTVILAFVLH